MSDSPIHAELWTVGLLTLVFLVATAGVSYADEHFWITPTLSATTLHETNLFSTPSPTEADFATRISSGVNAEYHSTIWTLIGRCSFDMEHFARHPELTTFDARRHAELGITYFPTRRLAMTAIAELSGTQTPSELNAETSLAFTRAAAQRTAVRGSFARQFDRGTTGTIGFALTNDTLEGSVTTRVREARIGAERHLSSRDTARAEYLVQGFVFALPSVEATSGTAQTFTIGMTRSITRQTSISVDVGPQVTSGSLAPKLQAVLRRQTTSVDLALSYGRTQAAVFGLAGTADSRHLAAAASWNLRRALQIRVSPEFFQSGFSSLQADVYRLAIDVIKPLTHGVALDLQFDAGVQHGSVLTSSADTIPHQTVAIRLVASPPVRPH